MEIKAKEMTMYSTATSVVNIIGNLINYFIKNNQYLLNMFHISGANIIELTDVNGPTNLTCYKNIMTIVNATVSNNGCVSSVTDIISDACDFKNYCILSTLDQALNASCPSGGQKTLRVEWACYGKVKCYGIHFLIYLNLV